MATIVGFGGRPRDDFPLRGENIVLDQKGNQHRRTERYGDGTMKPPENNPDYPALIRVLVRGMSGEWPKDTEIMEIVTDTWVKQSDADVREAIAYFGKQTIADYLHDD